MSGNEFQYEENGKKQDADIHNPILEDGDAIEAFASTYAVLKGQGFKDEDIEAVYGSIYRAFKERQK